MSEPHMLMKLFKRLMASQAAGDPDDTALLMLNVALVAVERATLARAASALPSVRDLTVLYQDAERRALADDSGGSLAGNPQRWPAVRAIIEVREKVLATIAALVLPELDLSSVELIEIFGGTFHAHEAWLATRPDLADAGTAAQLDAYADHVHARQPLVSAGPLAGLPLPEDVQEYGPLTASLRLTFRSETERAAWVTALAAARPWADTR